jgi:hypothetical protein
LRGFDPVLKGMRGYSQWQFRWLWELLGSIQNTDHGVNDAIGIQLLDLHVLEGFSLKKSGSH